MANEIINNIPQEVWDYLQCEAIIPYGNSNELLVIHRYDRDDYSVWFTDVDHLMDDTYGSSDRGSLFVIIDIIREVL